MSKSSDHRTRLPSFGASWALALFLVLAWLEVLSASQARAGTRVPYGGDFRSAS